LITTSEEKYIEWLQAMAEGAEFDYSYDGKNGFYGKKIICDSGISKDIGRDLMPVKGKAKNNLKIFDSSDGDYKKWCDANPDGVVANCRRGLSTGYYYVHKKTCHTIQYKKNEKPDGKFTERDYIKICSVNMADVLDWGVDKKGVRSISFCSKCIDSGYLINEKVIDASQVESDKERGIVIDIN
jgi:hypothetical protein